MGPLPNAYDPCIYSGYIHDPSDPSVTPTKFPITLGLYVDDFVDFSMEDDVESKLHSILSKLIPVDFMGIVEWFLDIHFTWLGNEENLYVNLN